MLSFPALAVRYSAGPENADQRSLKQQIDEGMPAMYRKEEFSWYSQASPVSLDTVHQHTQPL